MRRAMGDEEEDEEEEGEDEEREEASWAEAMADWVVEPEAHRDLVSMDCAVDAEAAEQVAVATTLTDTLREVEDMLRNVGMQKLAQDCREQQHKQKKRLRELAGEDKGVLRALTAQRDHDAAVAAKRRRLALEANDRTKALHDLKKQLREAEAALRAKKEAAVAERLWLTSTPRRSGNPRSSRSQKNRMAALDRLARGKGVLSEEQRGEWAWFKTHWDEAMCKEHKEEWPLTCAGWQQRVANDAASGNRSAMSQFVYSETVRTLGGQMALVIPAIISP